MHGAWNIRPSPEPFEGDVLDLFKPLGYQSLEKSGRPFPAGTGRPQQAYPWEEGHIRRRGKVSLACQTVRRLFFFSATLPIRIPLWHLQ